MFCAASSRSWCFHGIFIEFPSRFLVPSLEEEGHTVLDETRECNKNLPMYAKKRLFEKQFQPRDISSLQLT
jgi:hypothetical protein